MGQAKNRKSEIEALKASGQKAAKPKKELQPKFAGFFYSPTESVNNVLSIAFGYGPRGRALPIALVQEITSDEYLAKQDAEFAKDPSMKDVYFKQLDAVLAKVNDHIARNSQQAMTERELGELVVMAGNIHWLTMRGFLKQTEYNGTIFGA